MRKKVLLILFLLIAVTTACSSNKSQISIEDLASIPDRMEVFNEEQAKQKLCIQNKLEEKNYKDGLDCIECGGRSDIDVRTGKVTYPAGLEGCSVCNNTDRYNAEITAGNECQSETSIPLNPEL
jgi:hypothetical protein